MWGRLGVNISRKLGDRAEEGKVLGNLGAAFYSLDQHKKAIEFFTKSLNISRELGDRDREGVALGNLGAAFCKLGQYDKAIEFHTKHLNISRELAIGDRTGEGMSLELGSRKTYWEDFFLSGLTTLKALLVFKDT